MYFTITFAGFAMECPHLASQSQSALLTITLNMVFATSAQMVVLLAKEVTFAQVVMQDWY
jgi:hypothetical protein